MKRLQDATFDARKKAWRERRRGTPASVEAWAKEETRWRKAGIAPRDILLYLMAAGRERAKYEKSLKATQMPRAPFLSPKGKQVRRLLDGAKAFISFMQTERNSRGRRYFGDLGEQVDKMVTQYKKDYFLDREVSGEPRVRRNRPGEPWLKPYVLKFAEMFRAKGVSWNRTREMIFKALVLAGHGDVVSLEIVRNIIRESRRPRSGKQQVTRGGKTRRGR